MQTQRLTPPQRLVRLRLVERCQERSDLLGELCRIGDLALAEVSHLRLLWTTDSFDESEGVMSSARVPPTAATLPTRRLVTAHHA